MNLKELQDALVEMKELVESTITTASFENSKGETERRTDGKEALTSLVKGQHHILPIHEAVKKSLREALEGTPNHEYPEVGERRGELKLPSLKPKNQDVVIVFGRPGPRWYSPIEARKKKMIEIKPDLLDQTNFQLALTSISVEVRSQLRSVRNNINTLYERSAAQAMLQRSQEGMERSVMGEVYILPVSEYSNERAKVREVGRVNHGLVKQYITDYLKLSNRPDFNDEDAKEYNWRDHMRFERVALVVVDFDQDPPRFYQTLREMLDDEIVDQEFYDEHHEEYDRNLSPVDFAKDLVGVHEGRWPEIYHRTSRKISQSRTRSGEFSSRNS